MSLIANVMSQSWFIERPGARVRGLDRLMGGRTPGPHARRLLRRDEPVRRDRWVLY
ncbi:hypothetical protein SMICM304S_02367 [Streptomyces microflavus]